MNFRPCIDIHNGKVKQIVGGSLADKGNKATENFVSDNGADYYARIYKSYSLKGGHIILLNKSGTKEYEADFNEAKKAFKEYPNSMQIGGGITDKNALGFLSAGASHVIVTSFVFSNGTLNMDNLKSLVKTVGKDRIVLDLSCRLKNDKYYIVTDRWQKFTDTELTPQTLSDLSQYCDEFLIHAVDVEGKSSGIDERILNILSQSDRNIKITYAGGIKSIDDVEKINKNGKSKIDFTVGSSLDIFGGDLSFEEVVKLCEQENGNETK